MSGNMYDWDTSIYSQDGRIYQVEYATKAVENSETILGIVCKDGVIIAADKIVASKLLVEDTNRRLYHIDESVGVVVTGKIPDGRHLVITARSEAENYQKTYGVPMPGGVLSEHLGLYVHQYTLYARHRPFGAAAIVASFDPAEGYKLHMVEPNGLCYGYSACAIGKGKQIAKSEFDKQNFKEKTVKEALFLVAKTLTLCHEEYKSKAFELEVSVISADTNNRHEVLPREIRRQLEKDAAEAIEKEQM